MAKVNKTEALSIIEKKVKEMHGEIIKTQNLDEFKKFLSFAVYKYSFYNCMLIWSQAKNSLCMSASAWKKNGRDVINFKDKVWILCPSVAMIPIKDQNGNQVTDENGKTVKSPMLMGFNWGYVFEEKNTTGKPIPKNPLIDEWLLPEHETSAMMLPRLQKAIKEKNIPVIEYESESDNKKGSTNGKVINILKGLSNTDTFLTTIHEYAHYVMHFNEYKAARGLCELEAETVSWLIAERLGLPNNAVKYNALYNENYDLMGSLKMIFNVYNDLISMLGLKPEYKKPEYKKKEKSKTKV